MGIAQGEDEGATSAEESAAGVARGLEELVGYQLRRASNMFGAHFGQAMSGTGLRQALFGILSIIDDNPGINQGAVGRALGIQRANMVSLVNELVERRLIDRQMADDDRRAFAFTLTREGKTALADAVRRIEDHEDHLLTAFTRAERRLLVDLLKRIGPQAVD